MAAGPLALAAAASPQQFPFIDFKTRLLLPSCHCGSSRVGRRQASCPRAMPRLAGAGDSRWVVMAGAALPHSLAGELGCFCSQRGQRLLCFTGERGRGWRSGVPGQPSGCGTIPRTHLIPEGDHELLLCVSSLLPLAKQFPALNKHPEQAG